MRFVISLVIGLVLSVCVNKSRAQGIHDTTFEGHVKIVKESHYHFKLPVIVNGDFCNRLHSIPISKDIEFVEDSTGADYTYFFRFTLLFNKGSDIPSIKPRSLKVKSLDPITNDLILLLKKTKWKISSGSRNHKIRFACTLSKTGFIKVSLSSNDVFDSTILCE